MSAPTETRLYTPDDLLAMPDRDLYELVDGDLVELNVSKLSSLAASRLNRRLGDFCEPNDVAWVFGADCGYQCFPDRPNLLRKPDVSVILCERMPLDQLEEDGWTRIAPDIAVEVVSPNDTAYEVDQKVMEYLSAGVRRVWVVNPEVRIVHVSRGDGSVSRLQEADELTGEDVLPGFSCRIGDLFPQPAGPRREDDHVPDVPTAGGPARND